MLRTFARLTGYLCLAAAMATGLVDGVRMLSADGVGMSALGEAAQWLFPRQFPLLEAAVARNLHPLLWDPVLRYLLLLPAAAAMFLLGGLMLVLGRPAEPEALGTVSRP